MPEDTLTARTLIGQLSRHYQPEGRPPAGVFAAEVQSPDGTRRADALWAPLTQHGGGIIGHEVKISRADVLCELADPAKADAWARYCERWWLVVAHPGLIDGLTIPETWGVMAPPSGRRTRTMTVVREAPRLKPTAPGPAYHRLLAWYFNATHAPLAQAQANLTRTSESLERANRELYELRQRGGIRSPHAERVDAILRAASQRARREHLWGDVDDEHVIAAIVDSHAAADIAKRAHWQLQQALENVDRLADPLSRVRADIQARAALLPPIPER